MSDKIGFTNYTYKGLPISPVEIDKEALEASRMFFINSDNLYFKRKPPDTRSTIRKVFDETKRRISNAWYMLKGGDFE